MHAALSEAHERLGHPERALAHLRAQLSAERARLTEEARQRVGVLSAQAREAWARREAEHARRQADALRHAAHHDALTDLANRPAFHERLGEAVREGQPFAVLFLDLDGFKAINDTLGHAAGDELLVRVAQLLGHALSGSDVLARLGGDEFTVLARSARTPAAAEALAWHLVRALDAPLRAAGQDVFVTVSVGLALFPTDGESGETLLQHADLAMYAAKRGGKNGVRRFTPELNMQAHERLLVEHRLRGALGRGEFALHYQPHYDSASGTRCGWEVLLRWRPEGGESMPAGVFVPAAEDSGLIVEIGAWVLDRACARLAAWEARGLASTRLMVNVSPVQFARPDFVPTVQAALERHGVQPSRLELTERGVVRDVQFGVRQFGELRELGVCLALDDFGAGEAHLGALLRLPFDTLKLDKSLVQPLGSSDAARRVLRAVRVLAHELDLTVVAEGIETAAQLSLTRELGCDRLQGYWLGRPSPDPLGDAPDLGGVGPN